MPDMDLQIGIENEMFFKSHGPPLHQDAKNIKKFADALVNIYNVARGKELLQSDFSHKSKAGHYDTHNSTGKWTVTTDDAIGAFSLNNSQDVDIDNLLDNDGHPLEFVSPIFGFCRDSEWMEEVKTHWHTLLLFGNVDIDDNCATHVHVSPKSEEGWSLVQLKQVAQAVLYFEDAFQNIWAPSRREHYFTKSNKANNSKLKDREFGECCKLVQKCVDTDHLALLMQPNDHEKSKNAPPDRAYAWNFENTIEKPEHPKIGTIEFRCAPGVKTADHCLIWVEFGASFVQAAAQYGTQDILENECKPTVEGLREFIGKAEVTGVNNSDLLDIAFHGRPVNTDKEMLDIFEERIKNLPQ